MASFTVLVFVALGCSGGGTAAPTATKAPATASPATGDQGGTASTKLAAVMLVPNVFGQDWFELDIETGPVNNAARAAQLPNSDEAATKLSEAGRQERYRQTLRKKSSADQAVFGLFEAVTVASEYKDSAGAKAAFDYIKSTRPEAEVLSVEDVGEETYLDVTNPKAFGPTQYSYYLLFRQGRYLVEMVCGSVGEPDVIDDVHEQAKGVASKVGAL